MGNYPRFAAPLPKEWRVYFRALEQWIQGCGKLPARRPEDILEPFRDAEGKRSKRLISIRVDEHLLALTKEVARQHDLRYQAVIRLWIEEGLRRAIHEGVEDPDPCPNLPDHLA